MTEFVVVAGVWALSLLSVFFGVSIMVFWWGWRDMVARESLFDWDEVQELIAADRAGRDYPVGLQDRIDFWEMKAGLG